MGLDNLDHLDASNLEGRPGGEVRGARAETPNGLQLKQLRRWWTAERLRAWDVLARSERDDPIWRL